jgi:cell division septation protein DedD
VIPDEHAGRGVQHMARSFSILASVAAVMTLSACSNFGSFPTFGFDFGGGSSEPAQVGALPPAEIPAYAQGDIFIYDQDGAITQERVVSVSPDRITWTDDESDSSVIWTRDPYIVTPPLNWSAHPELGRGRQAIIGSPEQLFPLREGNVVAYAVRGSSETVPEGWQDDHRCAVFGQENVQVKAGTYTTFRIDCQRRDYTDTLYYSPVVQNVVLRERDFGEGRRSRKELVSVKLANDRTAGMAAAAPIAPVAGAGTEMIITADQAAQPAMVAGAGMAGAGMAGGTMAGGAMAAPATVEQKIARLELAISRLEKAAGLAPLPPAGQPMTAQQAAGQPMAMAAETGAAEKTAAAMTGAWAVHLASYRSQAKARAGWAMLQKKFPALSKLTMRTSEFDPGNGRGTYVRLLGQGLESKAEASAFCGPLKTAGQYCQAKGPLP